MIGLQELMSFQHFVGEFAVVGEEDQAHGVILEAAYWEDALRDAVEEVS